MKNIMYIDIESYYDTKKKYDLETLGTARYINHPLFKPFGAGVQFNDEEPFWVTERNLRQFFRSHDWSNYIIIAHNVKFDGSILAWKYGVNPGQWRDTQSMAKAIYGSSLPSFSLKYLADYFGFPPKGTLNTNGVETLSQEQEETLAEYCLTDVKICAKLYDTLVTKIPESQWPLMDWTVRAFTEPKLCIDHEAAKECQVEIEERKKATLAEIGVDREVFSSNPKFAAYLSSLGYKVPMKKNKKGELIPALARTDPEFIEMTKSLDPKLKQLCLARKEVKKTMEIKRAEKLQTLGETYPFDIIFSGADQTHRFSGGSGAGGNPQNFPKESILRRSIRVPEGSTLCVGDFKNIELRILAFLSREPKLIKAIREGINVYSEFGETIYKRKVEKDTPEYKLSKAAVLGLGYGMGKLRFIQTLKAEGIEVSEEFATQTVYAYRDYYTHVPNFWKLCEVVIRMMANGQEGYFPGFQAIRVKKHALILPSGLELKYPNLRLEDGEWVYDKYKSQVTKTDTVKLYGGKLTENICQAMAGEICKEAIIRCLRDGISPSGQVHDELIIVHKENDIVAPKILEKAMTDRLPWWPELILEVDLGEGKNWYDAKKPKKAVQVA